MKIDEPFHYDADPDAVVDMLADPEFQDRKALASGATSYEVAVSHRGDAPTTTLTRTLPVSGVPDVFSKFIKDTVEVTEIVEWDEPSGGQERGANVTLRFNGQPMVMKGRITLKSVGDGTDGRMDGDLKCNVPFVGGKAEKALAPQVIKGLHAEVEAAQAYLAERG